MKEVEKSYAAGLIDGEGSIMLIKRNSGKFRSPVVSLTNTSQEIISFLVGLFGGTVRKQKVYKEHHKLAWIWSVSNDRSIEVLTIIQPYLLIPEKRYRCHLILEEYKLVTKRNGRYSPEQVIQKLDFEHRFLHPQ